MGRSLEQLKITDFVNPAHRDVFTGCHLITHEILKDDSDLAIQVFQIVFTKVDPVEQDLPFGGIVKTRDQLHDRGLALAVFADESDALARMQMEVQAVENQPRASRDS